MWNQPLVTRCRAAHHCSQLAANYVFCR